MTLLRNFDYANKFFDIETHLERENIYFNKVIGWYKFIDGILTALLVLDDNLYFLFDSEKYLITDNYRVVLEDANVEKEKIFKLFDGQKMIISFSYHLPNQILNTSPFEYIDDTDFKWGDFIEKIINDHMRKTNFITNLA